MMDGLELLLWCHPKQLAGSRVGSLAEKHSRWIS